MLTPEEETEVIIALSFSFLLLCNNISLVTVSEETCGLFSGLTCRSNPRWLCAWLAEKIL